MDAVLDIKTYTPTTSNPASVSYWEKGLQTFPDRAERILHSNIRNRNYSAKNVIPKLGRATEVQSWKVNSEGSDDTPNLVNPIKGIDKYHLLIQYTTNIDFEPTSTALKVDKRK